MNDYPDRWVTVWRFTSIDEKQVVESVRGYAPDDLRYQHEYQKVIYRGPLSGWVKHSPH